ncbi:hypothetical protein BBJ28_00000874 [Nothophytophthora sp. Chile5]|nr:hypothetical protein BBJ28_00000874 [Nothophytophthora sp. Chile5]
MEERSSSGEDEAPGSPPLQDDEENAAGSGEGQGCDVNAKVATLLALECCPQHCLRDHQGAVTAVVASVSQFSSKEKKVSLLTALAVSRKAKGPIRERSKGIRVRFSYFLPMLGEVCRTAFAACYSVSEGTLMRYVDHHFSKIGCDSCILMLTVACFGLRRYRARVVEGVFFPKEHGGKGNTQAASINTEAVVTWLKDFATTAGQEEPIKVRRQQTVDGKTTVVRETKLCTWLPAHFSWEKLRLEYIKTIPDGKRPLSRRSFERIARDCCSDIRIRPRGKKPLVVELGQSDPSTRAVLRRLGVAVAPSLRRPALVATFSSDAETPSPPQMSEHQFMELADETLHQIQDWLDGIEEMLDESDIVFSVGASLLRGCMLGCWMEGWVEADELRCGFDMSSGPRRYEYDAPTGTWVNTRDGAELMELLRAEILETTGIEIY